jgi:hypothetical protein
MVDTADSNIVTEGVEKIRIITDPNIYSVIGTMKVTCPDCLVEVTDEKRGRKDVRHKAWGISVKNGLCLKDDLVYGVCGKNTILKYR